jgi:phosphoribosylaminoimidazolecarboxamide formyltransferase/IMP cyclohydrolase
MQKQIQSALISVFYKDGLEPIVRKLNELNVSIYSTGGTQDFIENLGIPCISVESVTSYPSILGGRVKTLHPKVFGGILARRNREEDMQHVEAYDIPLFDLVMVDLYPFEETVAQTNDEAAIIEKVDIGGVSLIRAAAKNHQDVAIIAAREQYTYLLDLLTAQQGATQLKDRKTMAIRAFEVCAHYDAAIANYFTQQLDPLYFQHSVGNKQSLRYGENPHQQAAFYGDLDALFNKLNGKELSYNNLVDTHAALQLIQEFTEPTFAIIKHTNVCGIASRSNLESAWDVALSSDPESAFGGVLIANKEIDEVIAEKIASIFFEILIAPSFTEKAIELLSAKKNRILLQQKNTVTTNTEFKNILNGVLTQSCDHSNYSKWEEVGAHNCSETEKEDLIFANLVCKHLKSNAIALVKNKQLIGKGCGQTSRIDSLKHAIEKAKQFNFSLDNAVLASDAFFPFDDCVRIAHNEGIRAVIQPGGSMRDQDTIQFCKENNMALVITGERHFKH